MKFAFLSARIRSRSPSLLTKESMRNLVLSRSKSDFYRIVERYGISPEGDGDLIDFNIKLDTAFNAEISNISAMVRKSSFLTFFAKRRALYLILSELQNTYANAPAYSGSRLQQLFKLKQPEKLHEIAEINKLFGFNINQDIAQKDLEDELVKNYYLKLFRLSGEEDYYKDITMLEVYLLQKTLKFKIVDMPYSPINKDEESLLIITDPLVSDLKVTTFLSKFSDRFALSDPLGGAVIVNYIYNLELHFKFIRLLFAIMTRDFTVDLKSLW